jgi:hypothetical protein
MSERRANIAAQAVTDHARWAFQYYQQEDPARLVGANGEMEFLRHQFAKCPALHILWDTGDAAKHRFFDAEPKSVAVGAIIDCGIHIHRTGIASGREAVPANPARGS